MIEFARILCPTDLSDAATRALVHAAALAGWYDARLDVLHVIPPAGHDPQERDSPAGGGGPFPDVPSRDAILAEIRRATEATGYHGTQATATVLEGRAHEVIVERARAWSADLIVMGTHGRSGFTRLFLGSVTEKVVRTARCPVLTVPPTAVAKTAAHVTFNRVLCPIDFSPSSRKALEYALDLARQANGSVTLLHVLEFMAPDAPYGPVDARLQEGRRRFAEHAREQLHALVSSESTSWCDLEETVLVDQARAYRAVLEHAVAVGADLIVMGAQGTAGVELTLYGSNTHHVVRAAPCPVLTVRA